MKAKILMLVTVFCLLLIGFALPTYASPFLACDLQPNVIASEVEIDGTVQPGTATVSGQNLLLFDVSTLGPGPHQFKARLQDASGWWGDWNANPLDASKPAQAGLKIVDQ